MTLQPLALVENGENSVPVRQNEFEYMFTKAHASISYMNAFTPTDPRTCGTSGPGPWHCVFQGCVLVAQLDLDFDYCVWEVRFVEFGPACCPSCALLLT